MCIRDSRVGRPVRRQPGLRPVFQRLLQPAVEGPGITKQGNSVSTKTSLLPAFPLLHLLFLLLLLLLLLFLLLFRHCWSVQQRFGQVEGRGTSAGEGKPPSARCPHCVVQRRVDTCRQHGKVLQRVLQPEARRSLGAWSDDHRLPTPSSRCLHEDGHRHGDTRRLGRSPPARHDRRRSAQESAGG